jgi:hypothetical protein
MSAATADILLDVIERRFPRLYRWLARAASERWWRRVQRERRDA